jgi:hypothetical protein
MKAEFTRDTFNPLKHFSRVLMQQGRVQLDADWNEQTAILLHYLRNLGADLIGPHGGPADIEDAKGQLLEVNCGFEIITEPDRIDALPSDAETKKKLEDLLNGAKPALLIGRGHYYVDGILCQNDDYIAYNGQPGYPIPGDLMFTDGKSYLLYLDVWERHVTYVEDEDKNHANPSIREVALNGADTATRAQVVWQIRAVSVPEVKPRPDYKKDYAAFLGLLGGTVGLGAGRLKARAKMPEAAEENPCIVSPTAGYRGTENQLYRVEIYDGGEENVATFVWSRENASVIFRILSISSDNTAHTTTVSLESLGRDARFGLAEGNWVEIVDDDYALQDRAEQLLKVVSVDLDEGTVTLGGTRASTVGDNVDKHPFLRRWDSKDGATKVVEFNTQEDWISLEDGVQIQFQPTNGGIYRTRDYWLIPARTATGDVEWPGEVGLPDAIGPHGVQHHYAPLWIVSVEDETLTSAGDCRRKFNPFAS